MERPLEIRLLVNCLMMCYVFRCGGLAASCTRLSGCMDVVPGEQLDASCERHVEREEGGMWK